MTTAVDPVASLAWARAIVAPDAVLQWSLADWDRAVRLARRHRLLARLAASLQRAGLMARMPKEAQNHLNAASTLSRAQTRAMLWAIERLPLHLDQPAHPLVLLKGAAYLGQDLVIAEGRLPSDLDVLVPKANLAEVRFRLLHAGWREPQLDAHDLRYYLEWSHELPPMRHDRHGIELDVHHNILPPRSGRTIDAQLLLADLRPSRWPAWSTLAPMDQLLHSAGHLFYDSEPRDRIRDLIDMDGLISAFGDEKGFWDELPGRAAALDLVEPLALACHFTNVWLGTAIPKSLHAALVSTGLRTERLHWLIPLMAVVLNPTEPHAKDSVRKRLAATVVLARYHSTRLPLHLLLPHLWRKWRAGEAVDESA